MATWLSGISKQHRTIRKNTFLWFGIYLLVFALVLLRFAWLQVFEGHHYRKIADQYHTRDVTLRAERGRILDRNLDVLALDDQRQSLFVDPSLVQYPEFTAKQLAPVLGMTDAEVLAKLSQQVASVTISADLSMSAADSVRRLGLPGIQVLAAGQRFQLGIDPQQVSQSAGVYAELADALGLPVKQLEKELATSDAPQAGRTPAVGPRWCSSTVTAVEKAAVDALHFPGILWQATGENYQATVDPRQYLRDHPLISSAAAAKQLAPVLGMSESAVERILLFRPRFVMLKPDLTEEALKLIQRLQGTLFVVQPGRVLEEMNGKSPKSEDEAGGSISVDEAVARLDDMLNDKKGPALVSKEQIRARLLPGGAPGELAVKMSKGQPDFIISRRLFAKPIAGVMYGLPGVGLTQEPRRHYPYGAMASATLGWVGDVRVHPSGVFGLELSEEKLLRGVDGREVKEIDARRRTIPERSTRTEPQDGLDLMLTIDLNIQQAAEEELAKAVQSSHALQGQCIVMDPKTGEILAIATYPTWDANAPGKSPVPLLNPAISNFYEPGSTFKIVPVIGALEEKLVRDGQQVTYCSGTMPIGRRAIHEAHHAHGAVDCGRLLEQSCNLGAATLALKLGPTKFLHWCEALGYGAKTGIELENESPGSLNRRNIEAKITLANMGFGQSLAVTPLQMVAAYSAVANGGEWIQPHLIKSRQNTDRTTWTAFTAPRRRVCAPETAALLRKYLERVVAQGTGTAAAVSGYRVGGKTGTAQKPPYYARKYIGSFIGVMPMDNPRLAIIAVIDEPKTSIYGGVVAGPVVAGVGQRALQYLSIPPTLPVKAAKKTTP